MLKVGLIGCGRISKKHSTILGDNLVDGIGLVAVCDIVKQKANKVAKKYNVRAYQSMNEMVQKEEIDLILVLTESGNHSKNVIELSKYGKDIIVEKPMALSSEDAESMLKACRLNGVKLFVVKQNRFNNAVAYLKEAIDNKRLGKLFLGTVRVRWSRDQNYYDQDSWRGTYEMDGGVISNQASHHLDLLQWLIGPIDTVFAKSKTALAKIEAEDTAVVILKFKNGALGLIEATTAVRPIDLEGSISILGSKGSVVIGGFAVNKVISWNIAGENNVSLEHLDENPKDVYGFGHIKFYKEIVKTLKNDKTSLVDGEEGIKTVKLINAIYESIKKNKEVSLQ
tara:strand:- start:1186 stop:2202 length:1017 start_codon:yes stop_codon:yes gene_type:complete